MAWYKEIHIFCYPDAPWRRVEDIRAAQTSLDQTTLSQPKDLLAKLG